jgi:anthranilate synthase/aminodeoxychorismate synthase-like glutamine amidotransferase
VVVKATDSALGARVLVLDNRDSFVFNLVDELRSRGAAVETVRSDLPLSALGGRLLTSNPHLVVLSPGPGRPESAGVIVEWLKSRPAVPVLGICLGHQALAVAEGGEVGPAPRPVHGRKFRIDCAPDEPLFEGLGGSFVAARYHSLTVTRVPPSMRVVATALDSGERLTMAIRHRSRCWLGLQFHPESILTPHGPTILRRFLDEARRSRPDANGEVMR